MTTQFAAPPLDTDLERFFGHFRVSQDRSRFPTLGTPVTIEAGGTRPTDARITVGHPRGSECLMLFGSFDGATGRLVGSYDNIYDFKLSCRMPGSGSDARGRRLSCSVDPKQEGVEQAEPASDSWDADEDGPG